MANFTQMEQRLAKLSRAFEGDGFRIIKRVNTPSGRLGVRAEHTTAVNRGTGRRKGCYYLEGTPYERGYLLGLLAEPEISDMAVSFADNIIFDFIGLEFFEKFPSIQQLVVNLLYELSRNTWTSQPPHVHSEVGGILDGCKKINPDTPVTQSRLIVMNVGFDVLCALIYSGQFLRKLAPQLKPEAIRLAMMCNAFSVFGDAAAGGHFFARDFMFASAGVLQNNLAHILYFPESDEKPAGNLYPYISLTAPGTIGSISAMNVRGVAAGVNMSPAANCDPDHVGINSLLLLRECILRGGSAAEAARIIQNAERGVSWNYVLSDGSNDTACTVEAGASRENPDFLGYPSKLLLPHLPDAAFLSSHNPAPVENGAAVRWCGAPFPESYLKFNEGLWRFYKSVYSSNIRLYEDAFEPAGYINRTPKEKNCPSGFYFAPQRTGKGIHITTNHFLLPHMRLCAMDAWTSLLTQGNVNDIQWRYDELNHQIGETISTQGSVDYQAAKRLADFLAPYGKFPSYYGNNPKSKDGKDVRIEGCVSLFDLKNRTVESHYGYYNDEWVKTTLPAYF